jgi:hypothetical protein
LSSPVLPPPNTSASLDDHCSPAATIKGKPFVKYRRYRASHPSELDITIALVLPPASFWPPTTSPSLLPVPFLTEQVVPPSSSTTSRRSSEVGQKKNSSHTATNDSVLGSVLVASLDTGRDVSLYHKRNLSANSGSCAHSSPAPS